MEISKIKMRNINKKAIILPEVLRIIIAVLCIVLLMYLAVKIYEIFSRSHELDQARFSLQAILDKSAALKIGEEADYMLVGPKNWRMMPYGNKLCLCPESKLASSQENLCKTQGVCLEFDKDVSLVGSDKNSYLVGSFSCPSYKSWMPSQAITNCLSLIDVPKGIKLSRTENGIIISSSNFIIIESSLGENKLETKIQKRVIDNWIFADETIYNIDFSPALTLKTENSGEAAYGSSSLSIQDNKDYIDIMLNTPLQKAPTPAGMIEKDGTVYLSEAVKVYWKVEEGVFIYDQSQAKRFAAGSAVGYLYKTTIKVDYDLIKNEITTENEDKK